MNTKILGIALGGLFCSSCFMINMEDGEVRYASLNREEPKQSEQAVVAEVELGIGRLEVEAAQPSQAYELDLNYNEAAFEPIIDFVREGDNALFRFRLSGEGRVSRRMGKTRLNLRLNPDTPLDLRARTGVGESSIDLSGMSVQALKVESGVGETRVSMLSPNQDRCRRLQINNGVGALEVTGLGNFGFERFDFRGGVGGSKLEFSGEWRETGRVEIEVGVGGVEILLPRDVGAEINATKSFLSGMNFPDFRKEGDTYYSNNIDRVSKVIRMRIRAGIGGVEVRWI
jgi:hypothetical protein